MAFTIEIENLDKLLGRFDRYDKNVNHAVWRGIERTAFEVQDEAKKNAPKDTATLINSIQITERRPEDLRATVQTTQASRPYAAYQNFGFVGPMQVRTYQRDQFHVFGRRLTTPIRVTIPAHTRVYNYAGYGYMDTAALKGRVNLPKNVLAEVEALEL